MAKKAKKKKDKKCPDLDVIMGSFLRVKDQLEQERNSLLCEKDSIEEQLDVIEKICEDLSIIDSSYFE